VSLGANWPIVRIRPALVGTRRGPDAMRAGERPCASNNVMRGGRMLADCLRPVETSTQIRWYSVTVGSGMGPASTTCRRCRPHSVAPDNEASQRAQRPGVIANVLSALSIKLREADDAPGCLQGLGPLAAPAGGRGCPPPTVEDRRVAGRDTT
jgi:hypothetical protein